MSNPLPTIRLNGDRHGASVLVDGDVGRESGGYSLDRTYRLALAGDPKVRVRLVVGNGPCFALAEVWTLYGWKEVTTAGPNDLVDMPYYGTAGRPESVRAAEQLALILLGRAALVLAP